MARRHRALGNWPAAGFARTVASSPPGPLVREFIHDSLYSKDCGYFAHRDVVGSPPLLDFPGILNNAHFLATIDQLYRSEDAGEAWFTPAEIFAPHYSYALGEYILTQLAELHRRSAVLAEAGVSGAEAEKVSRLQLFELGAGNGTNALHTLNYIQQVEPEVYRDMVYTTVEISPALAAKQKALLEKHHPGVHRVVRQDAMTLGQAGSRGQGLTSEPCFVVALEVLDNLPHDKVQLDPNSTLARAGSFTAESLFAPAMEDEEWLAQWQQVHVVEASPDGGFREEARPLSDRLIRRALVDLVRGPALHAMLHGDVEARALRASGQAAGAKDRSGAEALVHGFGGGSTSILGDWATSLQRGLRSLLYDEADLRTASSRPASMLLMMPAASGSEHVALPVSGPQRPSGPMAGIQMSMSASPADASRVHEELTMGDARSPLGAAASAAPPLTLWRAALESGAGADRPHVPCLFVPTGAVQLQEALCSALPRHRLIASDFDSLPPSKIDPQQASRDFPVDQCGPVAANPPIVASKTGADRKTIDHATYASPRPRGSADIFFATDFTALGLMWCQATGRDVEVARSSAFFDTWGSPAETRTLSGYNPLLESYGNTRFLLTK